MIKIRVSVLDRINHKGTITIEGETGLLSAENETTIKKFAEKVTPPDYKEVQGYGGERIYLRFDDVDLPGDESLLEGWVIGRFLEPLREIVKEFDRAPYSKQSYEFIFPITDEENDDDDDI